MTNEKRLRIRPQLTQRSRDLRHPLTPAKAKVWAWVRNQQLGYKIRRQHPIGHFIADFYCAQGRRGGRPSAPTYGRGASKS